MVGEVQLIQLARILGLDVSTLSHESARQAIASRPADLAEAFFREAVDSDDVIGIDSALEYLDSRLADFGNLVPPEVAAAIRPAFREHLLTWA